MYKSKNMKNNIAILYWENNILAMLMIFDNGQKVILSD